MGTQTFSRGVEQSVSTVVDGVLATSAAASFMDMSDIQRVEVLRGPQGMLFGKNASAGVLNIVTRNPTEDFQASIMGSYGDEEEIKINGFVSGPLSDNMRGRISAYTNQRDPIIPNVNASGLDYNDRDESGVRAKLAVDFSNNFALLLTANYAKSEQRCCAAPAVELVPGGRAEGLGVPVGQENILIDENQDSFSDTELTNVILDFDYRHGDYAFKSITSYITTDVNNQYAAINTPIQFVVNNLSLEDVEQFTQEFRVQSPLGQTIEYQAGLYYFNKQTDRSSNIALDAFGPGFAPFPNFAYQIIRNEVEVESESYAAFGQATWNVSDRARLTAGLRLNRAEVDMDLLVSIPRQDYPTIRVLIPNGTPGLLSVSDSDTNISWRLIGEYDVTDDAMIYASVARGYKGPGASTLSTAITATNPIVKPEIPTNFELGIKSRWYDNRFGLNATVFFSEFEDFQTSLVEPGTVPPIFTLDNAEKLETYGLELETEFQATENLFLSAWLGYVKAGYVDYQGAACYTNQPATECIGGVQDLSGKTLPNSPELTFNVAANYNREFDSLPFNGFATFNYYWQDDVQYAVTNGPLSIGDSYGKANLSLGIEANNSRYMLQFWVKNLFDEFHEVGVEDRFGGISGHSKVHRLPYDFERRIGVTARLSY